MFPFPFSRSLSPNYSFSLAHRFFFLIHHQLTPFFFFVCFVAPSCQCVKFHPNSNYLATGSTDKSLRLWDLSSGDTVRIFTGHRGAITSIALSPDGRTLASAAEDNNIILWDIASSRRLSTFSGHKKPVWSLDFSAEGTLLASGSSDQTVKLWDCTGSVRGSFDGMDIDGHPDQVSSRE
jgi:WD40 repeat protein